MSGPRRDPEPLEMDSPAGRPAGSSRGVGRRTSAPGRAASLWRRCRRTAARLWRVGALATLLVPGLLAAADCNAPSPLGAPATRPLGRQHHPVDRPLPTSPGFNAPTGCGDGFWYFDQNGNTRADPSEPRLFGRERHLACASCHAADAVPAGGRGAGDVAAAVFLRQDPATLCLTCHNL